MWFTNDVEELLCSFIYFDELLIIFVALERKNYTFKTEDLCNIFLVLYTPGSAWKAVISNFFSII